MYQSLMYHFVLLRFPVLLRGRVLTGLPALLPVLVIGDLQPQMPVRVRCRLPVRVQVFLQDQILLPLCILLINRYINTKK